jgi:hypothetical protein
VGGAKIYQSLSLLFAAAYAIFAYLILYRKVTIWPLFTKHIAAFLEPDIAGRTWISCIHGGK